MTTATYTMPLDTPVGRLVLESDGDVLAKMCIDEHGAVSSVKIVKSPADIADALQRALTTWKYKPYTVEGKVVRVCSAVTFIYTP